MNPTPSESNKKPAEHPATGPVTLDTRRQARLRSLHPGPLREDFPLLLSGQVIGRDAEQADLIHTGPDVSRAHAWIGQNDQNAWELRDLDSLNGVFLNGKRIEHRALLQPGDVIGFGRARAPDYEFITTQGSQRRIVALEGDGPWVIGRGLQLDVAIPADLSVSEQHAEIQVIGSGLQVRDLGSRNGLWQGHSRARTLDLEPGDQFMIGHHRIRWLTEHGDEHPDAIRLEVSSLGQAIGLRLNDWALAGRPEAEAVELAPGQLHGLHISDPRQRQRLLRFLGRDHLMDGRCFSQPWLSEQLARQRDRVALVDALDALPGRLSLQRWLSDEALLRLGAGVAPADRQALILTTLEALGLHDLAQKTLGQLSDLDQALVRVAAGLLTRPGLLVCDVGSRKLSAEDEAALLRRLKRLAGADLTLVLLLAGTGIDLTAKDSTPTQTRAAYRALRRPSGPVLSALIRRGFQALGQRPGALASLLVLPVLLVLLLTHWLALRSGVNAAQTVLLISTPLAALALTATRDALPRALLHRFGLLPDQAIAQAFFAASTVVLQFLLVLGMTTALLPLDVWSLSAGAEVLLSAAAGMTLGLLMRSASRGDARRALVLITVAGTCQAFWILDMTPGLVVLFSLSALWVGLTLALGSTRQRKGKPSFWSVSN